MQLRVAGVGVVMLLVMVNCTIKLLCRLVRCELHRYWLRIPELFLLS